MAICVSVCLSVCLSVAAFPHYGPGCKLGCPLIVRYWADLQSVQGFCCYDNIAPKAKCRRGLVLAVCLVVWIEGHERQMPMMIVRSDSSLELIICIHLYFTEEAAIIFVRRTIRIVLKTRSSVVAEESRDAVYRF